MYDTLDSTVAAEGGWDLYEPAGKFAVVPQVRLDLTSAGGDSTVSPMAGVALQQSAARLQLEVSQALGAESTKVPGVLLMVDGLF